MLQKNSKPTFIKLLKTSAKILFVAEAVAFGVSYGVWHRMNTNRDFRQYLSDNFPVVLEGYYKFGEFMSSDSANIRSIDSTIWEKQRTDK